MPKEWIRKRKREYYYRKAKREKYRSRAAYKLLQAVKKYRFMKPGDVVVDLGAAPGGWIQASRKIVGSRGFVLGVDLRQVQPINFSNVRTLIGDIREPQVVQHIKELLPYPADVVISDVSPNVSGVWELDHARQIDLARHSLQIATLVLKPRGNFFVKTFQGSILNDFVKEVKQHFVRVKRLKPKASRAKSAELYVLGMNLGTRDGVDYVTVTFSTLLSQGILGKSPESSSDISLSISSFVFSVLSSTKLIVMKAFLPIFLLLIYPLNCCSFSLWRYLL